MLVLHGKCWFCFKVKFCLQVEDYRRGGCLFCCFGLWTLAWLGNKSLPAGFVFWDERRVEGLKLLVKLRGSVRRSCDFYLSFCALAEPIHFKSFLSATSSTTSSTTNRSRIEIAQPSKPQDGSFPLPSFFHS